MQAYINSLPMNKSYLSTFGKRNHSVDVDKTILRYVQIDALREQIFLARTKLFKTAIR